MRRSDGIISEYTVDMYGFRVCIGINISGEYFSGHVSKEYHIDLLDCNSSYKGCTWTGGNVCFIHFPRKLNKSHDSISLIAHEAAHVAIYFSDYIGEAIHRNCQEQTAYMVGWVTRCTLESMREMSKK